MSIASKSLRCFGLAILLVLGLIAIFAAHVMYISLNVPVSILGDGRVHVNNWDNGFVHARGTWTIDGQNHAFPLNMSDISCLQSDGRCRSADARLSDRYLVADLESFKIEKWDDRTLEFTSEATCVRYVYVINRSTEKLTGVRIRKATTDQNCQIVSLEPQMKLSFVNGSDVVRSLEKHHAPTAFSIAAATAWPLFIVAWMVRIIRRKSPAYSPKTSQNSFSGDRRDPTF